MLLEFMVNISYLNTLLCWIGYDPSLPWAFAVDEGSLLVVKGLTLNVQGAQSCGSAPAALYLPMHKSIESTSE